ncbi:superfamily II DNA or RNA helicase [Archangium gephyra]|uniref:DNA-repair protein n=2 Tax=Archangium gephyra TaxID=48 RepID=A0AAC8TGS0_9BACT|nr:DNA-repair protein [Archangium gephyra]REG36111.1 superfamily II DNA or RNA helicase [Archangium gephyra]
MVESEGAPRGLQTLELASEYDTEENDLVVELYVPCFQQARQYDRAVGYFRASIYRELGEPLLDFVIRGGHVRVVCSPDMSERDEEAARGGYERRGQRPAEAIEADLVQVMEAMAGQPDEADCLDMLRLLIEKGALDLYVAVRPGGIYHRKIGLFADRHGNTVVFSGSGNETRPAISSHEEWGNDEEFDVFRSWGEPYERGKAERKGAYLERLFSGGTRGTQVRPLNQTERDVLMRFRSHRDFEDCRAGARKRARNDTVAEDGLYHYQKEAVRAWEAAGGRGLLAMATGLGKTITSLFAIRRLVEAGRPILILVPSSLLLEQWLKNLRTFLPDAPVLLAGGGYDWRADSSKRLFVGATALPRIVLATMQTAATEDFLEFFRQAKDPVLVVDEVHRLGSPTFRRILELPFAERLGLSATPQRLHDDEGNLALSRVFGERPVFELGLGDHVRLHSRSDERVPVLGHFLCPYDYDFEVVHLDSREQGEWDGFTREIQQLAARTSRLSHSQGALPQAARDKLRNLLIQRARIIKHAAGKPQVAETVLSTRYEPGGRWIVYCDDSAQLNLVTNALRRRLPQTTVLNYHSGLSSDERARVLEHFTEEASIIVAIRCLDEGVDLPRADGAVILASSSNPREYIQRRGRILRKAPGKERAHIVDTLVLPAAEREHDLRSDVILRSELARAYTFAMHSLNKDVLHRLWRLCERYELDLHADAQAGIEDEEMNDEHG